jgi:glutamyl-tRNA synthetase
VISRDQAIEWFDLDAVGRAPSRFDMAKLDSINSHHLRETEGDRLVALVAKRLNDRPGLNLDNQARTRITRGLSGLIPRAKTLNDLADGAAFYAATLPLSMNDKAAALLGDDARQLLAGLLEPAAALETWTEEAVERMLRDHAARNAVKLGAVAQPLRAALTGSNASPGIFEVLAILGRDEARARIQSVC